MKCVLWKLIIFSPLYLHVYMKYYIYIMEVIACLHMNWCFIIIKFYAYMNVHASLLLRRIIPQLFSLAPLKNHCLSILFLEKKMVCTTNKLNMWHKSFSARFKITNNPYPLLSLRCVIVSILIVVLKYVIDYHFCRLD